MTSLFQARRSAEELAAAIDGEPGSTRARTPETESLLELVGALRAHDPVRPREAFSADLRERLMAEAETALQPGAGSLRLPPRERGPLERRLAVAASAFVIIGGTTTMGAAAQSALPGEALYPIKRGIERAEAQLNTSPAGKGRDVLGQASDRLVEVEGLLSAGSDSALPRVSETLAQFGASATEGAHLLFESYRESGDPESIVEVRRFTTTSIASLESLSDDVPASAQPELTAAAIVLQDLDAQATALCSGCAVDLPVVEVPDVLLARAEADRALQQASASVRALDNNHPVVVPKSLTNQGAPGPAPAPAPQQQPAAPADGPSAEPVPTSAPSSVPAPMWSPKAWPSLLPKPEGDQSTQDDPGVVEDLTDDLSDTLSGVVETLLPDLSGDDGLLP